MPSFRTHLRNGLGHWDWQLHGKQCMEMSDWQAGFDMFHHPLMNKYDIYGQISCRGSHRTAFETVIMVNSKALIL